MDKADARMDQSAERAEAMAKDLGESAKQAANTVMDKVDDATITAQVSAGPAPRPGSECRQDQTWTPKTAPSPSMAQRPTWPPKTAHRPSPRASRASLP